MNIVRLALRRRNRDLALVVKVSPSVYANIFTSFRDATIFDIGRLKHAECVTSEAVLVFILSVLCLKV
jgi:hypothetical protein